MTAIDFETIFEASMGPQAVLDRGYRFIAVNQAFCDITGVDKADLLGVAVLEAFPEDVEQRDVLTAIFERAFAGERISERVHYAVRRDKDDPASACERWWNLKVAALPTRSGAPELIVQTVEDCTAEVEARRMSEAVAGEIQHRMGNAFALIAAIARRTFGEVPEARELTRKFEGRISALAEANRISNVDGWCGTTIRALAEAKLSSFGGMSMGSASLSGPEIHLDAEKAQAVSMTLHELATNALKYNNWSGDGAQSFVEWSRLGETGFSLEWREEGVNQPCEPMRAGFGSLLLLQILPHQLGGEATRSFEGGRMVYRLTAPGPE